MGLVLCTLKMETIDREHDYKHWKSELHYWVLRTENSSGAKLTTWDHFANNMLCMCFELSPCFLCDRLHFTTLCIRATIFFLVLEKGMFCLIQCPCVWQYYCEALDVTSLLFQKPLQFPLNHKATAATINKWIDPVDGWIDRHTDKPRKTERMCPSNYSCRRLFQRHYFPQVVGLSQIWKRNEIASSEKPG